MIEIIKPFSVNTIRRNFSISVILAVSLVFFACGGGGGPGPANGPDDPTPKTALTVAFDKNGGDTEAVPKTITVAKKGAAVETLPKPPTRKGYAFTGWNTKQDGKGGSFTAKTPVNGSITVYAQWKANTYTVKFDKNDSSATGSMSNQNFVYDTAKNLTANAYTNAGYVFVGWALSDTGSMVYVNEENVKNLSATNGAAVTLYAVWGNNTYTVGYDANGGSGTMTSSMFTVGGGGTLSMNSFTRPGYTFGGWSTTAGGTVEYTDGGGVTGLCSTPGETVILYAQWTYAGSFAPGSTGPGGGTIFYVDPSPGGFTVEGYGNPGDAGYFASYTAHYLEAAPSSWHIQRAPDDPHLAWAPTTSPAYLNPVPGLSVSPGTEDQAIGRGKKNTALILAYVSSSPATNAPAAYACNTYSSPNGTGGWFLPSLGELNQIYINGSSVGNLDTSYYYWSSSQFNNYYAWSQNFVNGYQVYGLKDIANVVRAIRAF